LEGITNGVALGNRCTISVLVEGALGLPKQANRIEVISVDECRWNRKELEMVELEVTVIPFVPLFATSVSGEGFIECFSRNGRG
jgi:hypothetical protein